MIPRCSSTVAVIRSSVRKSCTRTTRMRSLTEASISARARVAAGQCEPDVEVLVDEHELRVGVFGGVVLERHPVTAQIEQRRAIVGHGVAAVAHGATNGGEFERLADLVQLGDAVHVGERRLEAALGVALHVTFGVEAGERLADRRAGHVEHRGQSLLAEPVAERELAEQQLSLQRPMRRLTPRLRRLGRDGFDPDVCIQSCTRCCTPRCIHVTGNVRKRDCSGESLM